MDILKIKKIFPNLPNKKINLVQKVMNGDNSKPKPKINMTTKGPLCKQVIVPINNKLAKRFLKDLSIHIININHALKNILSNIVLKIKELLLLPTIFLHLPTYKKLKNI